MAELNAADKLQHSTAMLRLPTLHMSRPGKGVLLSLFIEYKLHEMTRQQRELAFHEISEKFLSSRLLHSCTKNNFDPRHMLNYYRDFNRPTVDHEGMAMPFEYDDGNVVMGGDHNLAMDTELIDRQESLAPGSRDYWSHLIVFDEICEAVTTTTDSTPEEQMSHLQEMHELREHFAKR